MARADATRAVGDWATGPGAGVRLSSGCARRRLQLLGAEHSLPNNPARVCSARPWWPFALQPAQLMGRRAAQRNTATPACIPHQINAAELLGPQPLPGRSARGPPHNRTFPTDRSAERQSSGGSWRGAPTQKADQKKARRSVLSTCRCAPPNAAERARVSPADARSTYSAASTAPRSGRPPLRGTHSSGAMRCRLAKLVGAARAPASRATRAWPR
jgi:hypothetical protein